MLGYVQGGKYHKGSGDIETPVPSSLVKAQDHDDQRFMHQAELVQPYDALGRPNPEFIETWPTEAKEYGLIGDYDAEG